MDRELWEILEKESVGTHELTESDGSLEKCDCVTDAEGVKYGGHQHVLADECKETVSLHDWQRVLQITIDPAQSEDLNHRVGEHKQYEDRFIYYYHKF